MKDAGNALQTAAVSLMVIPLAPERLKGRKSKIGDCEMLSKEQNCYSYSQTT